MRKTRREHILSALERRGKGQARATDGALHIERHRMVLTILLLLSLVSRTQHDRSCAKYARTLAQCTKSSTENSRAATNAMHPNAHNTPNDINQRKIITAIALNGMLSGVHRVTKPKGRDELRIVSSGKLCEKCTLRVALGR